MELNAILSADEKWGIGKNNDLLFSIPDDMKFFRKMTLGSLVILGRKNLLSFPGGKPLPKRRNIVISTTMEPFDGVEVCRSLDELFELLQGEKERKIFVIGGEEIYRQLLPFCRYAYVTRMYRDFGAEKFFPDLDAHKDWVLVEEGEMKDYEGLKYCFKKYENTSLIED